MPQKQSIPPEIQDKVQKPVDEFNQKNFNDEDFKELGSTGCSARFKGQYLYLDRDDLGKPSPICRLKWNGKMDDWDFTIYMYSDNRYESEEWSFPGTKFVDGTVTGAMKAGMKAYPI
jgi:hypothetical protein